MGWLLLLGATVADVGATWLLDASNGFARRGAALVAIATFALTIYLYGLAITRLPAPLAYALFGAVGTALTAGIGLALGLQPRSWPTFVGLALIIAGVTILPLSHR